MCVCVHHVCAGAHRGQKMVLAPLELELRWFRASGWELNWVLYERTVRALNC